MNIEIEDMLCDAEGRYLEATEQSLLTAYAESLDDRLRTMRALQQHESEIVNATMDALWQEFPDMKANHVDAKKKGVRDLTLVMRYASMAMVRDSIDFLEQKLLYWFRTIINAFDMNQPLVFAYQQLDKETRRALTDEDYQHIAPYLARAQDILAPEPDEVAAE